jgi:hypothetical protein
MAAYLGKISAVISANTQDFTRKLSTAKDDVDRFKSKLDGMRLNLNTRALDGTLTKLQLFQRTLQEARQLKIDVTDLRRMYRLFEDVGRPLTNVKNQVEGLSVAVQAQLYPSLGLAQKGFQDLYRRVQAGGKASRDEVNALIAQVERLDASLSVVKGIASLNSAVSIGNAGPTFVQGRAQDALMNAAKARAAAGKLPGGVREDPFFQTVASQTATAGNQIEVLTAKVEKFKLALSNTPGLSSNPKFMQGFADAQSQLDATAEHLSKLNAMLSGRTGNIAVTGTMNDKLKEMLPAKDAARQQIIQNYRDTLRGIAAGGGSTADRVAAKAETRTALNAESVVSGPAVRAQELIERAGKLKNPGLSAEGENLKSLAADTQAAAGNTVMFKAKMDALNSTLDAFEGKVAKSERVTKQFSMFMAAAGNSASKLDPQLEHAVAAVQTARQLRGNYGSDNLSGRINMTAAISGHSERMQRLIEQRDAIGEMKISDKGGKTAEQRRAAALVRAQEKMEKENVDLVKKSASESKGVFNEQQAMRTYGNAKKNQGSMGAGRFAGADLAFQQAAFAVDDFMSATGGVEYKIRAISNNITQMGLMLGTSGVIPWLTATKGLFIGLGVVMGGQLAVQLMKHSKWFQEYEKRGEVLNEVLQKQRDRAQSAAAAFGKLADAIKDASFSGSGGVGVDRRLQASELFRKSRESLEDRVAMQDTAYVGNLAQQNALREQQKKSNDPARIAGLEMLIRDLENAAPRLRREALAAAQVGKGGNNNLGKTLAAFEKERIEARLSGELFNAATGGRGAGAVAKAARERAQRDIEAIDPNRAFADSGEALKAFEDELRKAAELQQKHAGMLGSPMAFRQAGEEIAKLERVIAALKLEALEEGFAKLAKNIYAAADDIDSAQKRLATAVEAGVPMALTLQVELNSLAEELQSALKESQRLRDAKDFEGAAESDQRALEIANRRGDVVGRARAVGETARSQPLSFFGGMAEAQRAQAETVVSKRTAFINESNRLVSEELNRKAQISGNPFDLQNAEDFNLQMKDIAESFLVATMASNEFGKALEKFATGLGNTVVNELQGEEDKARRAVNKAEAGFRQGVVGTGPRRAFDAAEADAKTIRNDRKNAEDRNLSIQQELERARDRFERGIDAGTGAKEDVDRARKIRALDERAADMTLLPSEQLAAKQEAERLRLDQQRAFENTPQARAMRADANDLDATQQATMQKIERLQRGREMVVSDTQKRREEAERKAADAVEALMERRDGKDVFAIGKDRNDAAKTAMAAMAREIAPAFVGYGEEVKNAQLGGPSRQALNASDITTMQGQSELSRLLRGDDPSKDINLVELQKQTAALEGIEKILENQAVVDFR